MKTSYYSLLFLCLFACKKKDDAAAPVPTPVVSGSQTIIVKNLKANADKKGHFTLYSFKNDTAIALIDSNTTKWDVGFNATTIILNGGTSGPGGTTAQMQTGLYDDMAAAPETGYTSDDNTKAYHAIPTGSGNGWYNYDGNTHVISSIPGRVIVVKTTDSRYVKMEILSYYKNMPANPVNTDSARFYSFRYLYQVSGSRTF